MQNVARQTWKRGKMAWPSGYPRPDDAPYQAASPTGRRLGSVRPDPPSCAAASVAAGTAAACRPDRRGCGAACVASLFRLRVRKNSVITWRERLRSLPADPPVGMARSGCAGAYDSRALTKTTID